MSIDPLPLPVPQYPVAIEAVNKKEEDKVGTFLTRAVENDPTLRVARNEQTHPDHRHGNGRGAGGDAALRA